MCSGIQSYNKGCTAVPFKLHVPMSALHMPVASAKLEVKAKMV